MLQTTSRTNQNPRKSRKTDVQTGNIRQLENLFKSFDHTKRISFSRRRLLWKRINQTRPSSRHAKIYQRRLRRYTKNWAVIAIDASKVDASNFVGNVIDLGTRMFNVEFKRMMYPNVRNTQSFKYRFHQIGCWSLVASFLIRRCVISPHYSRPARRALPHGNQAGNLRPAWLWAERTMWCLM